MRRAQARFDARMRSSRSGVIYFRKGDMPLTFIHIVENNARQFNSCVYQILQRMPQTKQGAAANGWLQFQRQCAKDYHEQKKSAKDGGASHTTATKPQTKPQTNAQKAK